MSVSKAANEIMHCCSSGFDAGMFATRKNKSAKKGAGFLANELEIFVEDINIFQTQRGKEVSVK